VFTTFKREITQPSSNYFDSHFLFNFNFFTSLHPAASLKDFEKINHHSSCHLKGAGGKEGGREGGGAFYLDSVDTKITGRCK
jgi:hypothetical protein